MWAGYIASHLLDDPGVVTYKLKEINAVHVRTGLFSFHLPFCFAKDSLRRRVCCGKVISPELNPKWQVAHCNLAGVMVHVMLTTIRGWCFLISPHITHFYEGLYLSLYFQSYPFAIWNHLQPHHGCSKIQVVPLDHCHRTGVPPLGGRRCQGLQQLLGNSKWEVEDLGTRVDMESPLGLLNNSNINWHKQVPVCDRYTYVFSIVMIVDQGWGKNGEV